MTLLDDPQEKLFEDFKSISSSLQEKEDNLINHKKWKQETQETLKHLELLFFNLIEASNYTINYETAEKYILKIREHLKQ